MLHWLLFLIGILFGKTRGRARKNIDERCQKRYNDCVMFLVNKDNKPLMAKSAGKGALIGVIVSIVFFILSGIIAGSFLGSIMYSLY